MNPVLFCFYSVGRNVVLRVHLLALKFGLCLFHSPALVLSQYTVFLTSMWSICVYFLVILSGVVLALLLNIYPKIINYEGEIDWTTGVCPYSRVFY